MILYSDYARHTVINRIEELIKIVSIIPGNVVSYQDASAINGYLNMLKQEISSEIVDEDEHEQEGRAIIRKRSQIKSKRLTMSDADYTKLSSLAEDVYNLRQGGYKIDEVVKNKVDDIRAIMDKHDLQTVSLPNFTIIQQHRVSSTIDRDLLEEKYPRAFDDCVRYTTNYTQVRIKPNDGGIK